MELSGVRIKEHFGLVTNDTNTTQFSFLVSPPKNKESIEKRDIICLDHPIHGNSCQILAEVKEITSYEQVAGSTIGERVGKMLGTAKIIGYVDLSSQDNVIFLQSLLAPPNPGSRVYVPYAKFLEDIFTRGTKGKPLKQPLNLGKTEIMAASENGADQQINFYIDATDLISKHTLISAIDGAGKKYTVAVIIEELIEKTNHRTVILDPSNEYNPKGNTAELDLNCSFDFPTQIINADSKGSEDAVISKINQCPITIVTSEKLSMTEKNEDFARFLKTLAKAIREKTIQPILLVIEDAEDVLPQVVQEILSTKPDMGTVLVTSHPTLLGGKVLSQIQNFIIGKTIDPQDLAHVKNASLSSDEQLASLNMGEWIVNGLDIIRPTKIYVRERNSKVK